MAHSGTPGHTQLLPAPTLPEAVDGLLDPSLAQTSVIVAGQTFAAGDRLTLTWSGTQADGAPLEQTFPHKISAAGQPVTFSIDGPTLIAPLDNGTLEVFYQLIKGGTGDLLDSEHARVQVGEPVIELRAPTLNPPAHDGVLYPDAVAQTLEIVIRPWSDMRAGQTLHLLWEASNGPPHDDFLPIGESMLGKPVAFAMSRARLDEYKGAAVAVSYLIEEPEQPLRPSGQLRFSVAAPQAIDAGPLRVMGARFNVSVRRASSRPRMLSALQDETLAPLLAEWRYEDEDYWRPAIRWIDSKPWLKLYVRSSTETRECRPANIIGSGAGAHPTGMSAFVAIRDEVMGDHGPEVDMVAWGNHEYGGAPAADLLALDNIVEVTGYESGFCARLRDGSVAWWNGRGRQPQVPGNYVQVRSNASAFAGIQANGELLAWGHASGLVPEHLLEHRDYVDVCGASSAFAARRSSGHVVAWGAALAGGELRPGQEALDDIVELASNAGAFAALRDHNGARSVIAWGGAHSGSEIPDEIARLTNVRRIAAATADSFCVLLQNGEIRAWPASNPSGVIPDSLVGRNDIVEVSATNVAFCARLGDGSVVAWGEAKYGGELPTPIIGKTDIVQVASNDQAFVALRSNGSVIAWGHGQYGGGTSGVAAQLFDVRAIYGNPSGFTALTHDGRVVTWGLKAGGGNSEAVQEQLLGKVTHSRLLSQDEAVRLAGKPSA